MKLPVCLLRFKWPPSSGLMPGDTRFDEMVESIGLEGIRDPVTINLDWRVVDGHHRVAAARLLGIHAIEVRVWTGTEFVQ